MPMLVAAPLHENLGEIEKLAKEFDIKIAIHTHGPEDPNFPTPKIVLDAVKGMDPRMGSSAISRAFAGRRRTFCTAFQ